MPDGSTARVAPSTKIPMDKPVDRNSIFLIALTAAALVASVSLTYWRTIVTQDFPIIDDTAEDAES